MEKREWFTYPRSKLALFREDGELYLTLCRAPLAKSERRKLIRVALTLDNKELRGVGFASGADKLTLTAQTGIDETGTVEFCFEDANCLRLRGRGRLALKFCMDGIQQFENGAPREDGSLEAAYVALGKLLFVPLSGALYHDARWIPAKAQTEDYSVVFLPSAESGIFEAAVHEYFSNGVRYETYAPFDNCAANSRREFDAFRAPFGESEADRLNLWRQRSERGYYLDKLESTAELEGYAADFLLGRETELRHRTAGDFPVYYHVNETGFPDLARFPRGVPVKAPDLLTWLALRSGGAESERLVKLLVTELWCGGKFVFLNAKTGVECNENSLLRLVPLLLGERLPQDILSALREDLAAHRAELPATLRHIFDRAADV